MEEDEFVSKQISAGCWALTGVHDADPPFIYSIGNHHLGLPELLMIGACDGNALNAIVDVMRKRNAPFNNGEIIDIGGRLPCKVVDVKTEVAKDRYTCGVFRYYGTEDYRLQQVLIPDREGRFPDDAQCAEPYASCRIAYEHGGFVPWDAVRGS